MINKRVGVGIKVIVELKAKPGQRDELLGVIERMMTDGPPMPGSLGATFYNAVDDPDMLVEIADWESAVAREAGSGLERGRSLRRVCPDVRTLGRPAQGYAGQAAALRQETARS